MNYEMIIELLQNEVLELRVKLQKSETNRAAWQTDSEAARHELQLLTIERNKAEDDCDEIRDEIIQLRNLNNSLLETNAFLQKKNAELQIDYGALQKENKELLMESASCETLCNELTEQRGELQKEFDRVRKLADSVQVVVNQLQERNDELLEQNRKLRSEKEILEQSFKDSQFNLKYWYNETEKLKTDYNQLAGTAGKVATERDELERERDHFLDKYNRAAAHKTNLQAENNSLILQRDELQRDLKEQIDAGIWLKKEVDKIRKEVNHE